MNDPVIIYVMNGTRNFAQTQKIIEPLGKLPTHSEFIRALDEPIFRQMSQGKSFWLGDNPDIEISGHKVVSSDEQTLFCKIDKEKGTIEVVLQADWRNLEGQDKRATLLTGNGPIGVHVFINGADSRINIGARNSPSDKAWVAFVPYVNGTNIPSEKKVAAQRELERLIREDGIDPRSIPTLSDIFRNRHDQI